MMPLRTFFFASVWIAHIVAVYILFPYFGISGSLPIVLLLGIGTWMYGRSIGLLLVLSIIPTYMLLTSFLYADILVFYQFKFTSIIFLIIIVFIISELNISYYSTILLNDYLDKLVDERNNQLRKKTRELIKYSENRKVEIGQILHDGIGQQLTGIQLICSSIKNDALNQSAIYNDTLNELNANVSEIHAQMRRISRLLFPIKIGNTGVVPALYELASSLRDFKCVSCKIVENIKIELIPVSISLSIYRICQEIVLHAVDELHANLVELSLVDMEKNVEIFIRHNGVCSNDKISSDLLGLLQYRLQLIDGKMTPDCSMTNLMTVKLLIPKASLIDEKKEQ